MLADTGARALLAAVAVVRDAMDTRVANSTAVVPLLRALGMLERGDAVGGDDLLRTIDLRLHIERHTISRDPKETGPE